MCFPCAILHKSNLRLAIYLYQQEPSSGSAHDVRDEAVRKASVGSQGA